MNNTKENKEVQDLDNALTKEDKDNIVRDLLITYRKYVWCPTIARFIKYNKGVYYDRIRSKLTRTVLLTEYGHLFTLGKDNRIMDIH